MIVNLTANIRVGSRLRIYTDIKGGEDLSGIEGTIVSLDYAQGNVYQVARVKWDDGVITNVRVSNIEAKKESNEVSQ